MCCISLEGHVSAGDVPGIKRVLQLALAQEVKQIWINCRGLTDVEAELLYRLALYQHLLQQQQVNLQLLHLSTHLHLLLVSSQLDHILPEADNATLPEFLKNL